MGGASGFGWGGGHGHVSGASIRSYLGSYPCKGETITRAVEAELRERGIEPQIPIDGEETMSEKSCNCAAHIVFTVLICTIIFMFVWELT